MTYSTLMVHMSLDGDSEGLLAIATSLAERGGYGVIGVAARQPLQIIYGAGGATELVELDRQAIQEALNAAERRFRAAMIGRVANIEWRGEMTAWPLAEFVAHKVRAADLILTAPDVGVGFANSDTRMSVGDLVMRAGRPVLIVPGGAKTLNFDHALVAWKDTREARRATADALPLLKFAGDVTVVEISDPDFVDEANKRLDDVAAWLASHGIAAKAEVVASNGHEPRKLEELAHAKKAGLMIAGAYGRARLLEWVFGGVTSDLLLHPGRCTLVSH